MTPPQKPNASARNKTADIPAPQTHSRKEKKVFAFKASLQRIGAEALKNTRAIAFLVIGCTFTILVLFLYKNVYVTMTQAEQVIVLQQEVATEKINLNDFNIVKKYLDARTSLPQNTPLIPPSQTVLPLPSSSPNSDTNTKQPQLMQ
ncbi:MAG TPA: hypothetical protein VJB93_02170 [Patescibacteria group bacterium]|nr:hypothetical protein [Patescibacteria group bacterium]